MRLVQLFHALSGPRTSSERVGRWRPWIGRRGRWSRAASVGRPLATVRPWATASRPLGSMAPHGVRVGRSWATSALKQETVSGAHTIIVTTTNSIILCRTRS